MNFNEESAGMRVVVSERETAGNPLDKGVPPESTTTTLEILGLPVRED